MISPCDPSSTSQLWKWGSGHRLFNVGSSQCLALDLRSKTLSLVDCGSNILLWWRCLDGAVYTVYEMALVLNNDKVSTKRNTSDTWQRGGSQDSICQKPYRGECGFSFKKEMCLKRSINSSEDWPMLDDDESGNQIRLIKIIFWPNKMC